MRAARARGSSGRTRGRTSNHTPTITTTKPVEPTAGYTGVRIPTITPAPWAKRGKCAGNNTNLWYPPSPSHRDQINTAKAICADCPVKLQCRQWALDNNEREGIWGGLTTEERDNYGMAGTPYAPPKTDGRRLHGHRAKYQQGCKCAPCKSANAAYIREKAHEQANQGGA